MTPQHINNVHSITKALEDRIEYLNNELEANSELAHYWQGLLGTAYDLVGQMAISLHQTKTNQIVKPNRKEVMRSVDWAFSHLSRNQRAFIKKAVKFHILADKLNSLYAPLVPAWRDDYPLSEITFVDYTPYIQRYY